MRYNLENKNLKKINEDEVYLTETFKIFSLKENQWENLSNQSFSYFLSNTLHILLDFIQRKNIIIGNQI
jgi:predicted transcriptional regulator